MKLDEAQRTKVIDGVIAALHEEYVFPTAVPKIAKRLRANTQRYATKSPEKLAKLLSQDLHEITRDKHLAVSYSEAPIGPDAAADGALAAEQKAAMRVHAAQFNAFFVKLERLPGNIGYLRLDGFAHPMVSAGPAAAAMTFLADTDELIIDLRTCGGGHAEAVAMMISYLFDGSEPVRLNDIYWRPDDTTRQHWIMPVAGRRYADKPVYVLVGPRTFSGAEDFAYTVRTLKRAKIVGEPTGGGAHPCRRRRLTPNFAVIVPIGRSINPITGRNWERVGVTPDIKVAEAKAFDAAYVAALRSQRKRIDPKRMPKDFVPSLSDEIDRALENAGAKPAR